MIYRLIVSGDEEARNVFREASLAKGSIILAHLPFDVLPDNIYNLISHKYDEIFVGMCRNDRELHHMGTLDCVDVYYFDVPVVSNKIPLGFQYIFKLYEGLLTFYLEEDISTIWLDQREDDDEGDEDVD